MFRRVAGAGIAALVISAATFNVAAARTIYDGSWNLTIVTQRGACDRTYNFQVNINNGIVSHPNLVRLRGRVAPGGTVRVSVEAGGKFASGSGKLTRSAGRGRWAGHSGGDRCSGYWYAQKY
jgi:hypothetical protein